jgi:isoquinoline 1-oxidoreductase subunit beta
MAANHDDALPVQPGRREFLKVTALGGGALLLGFALPQPARGHAGHAGAAVNAWIRIDADGKVTFLTGKSEMGQGAHTGLAQILADELEAPWAQVAIENSPVGAAYNDPAFPMMLTGGSMSISGSFVAMRTAAAAARALLVEEAAAQWGVPAAECRAVQGQVTHAGSNRKLGYGALAAGAAKRTPPAAPVLKPRSEWRYIGQGLGRLDSAAKSKGEAKFGLDIRLPGQQYAMVARPPFGGKITSANRAAALKVPGVKQVFDVPQGIAVVATTTWAAKRGRDALAPEVVVETDPGFNTAALAKQFAALAATPGKVARADGDIAAAATVAHHKVEGEFAFPFLSHSPMEPLNCTALVQDGTVQLWVGSQAQTIDQGVAAAVAGVAPDKVVLNTTLLGGGFGRRANPVGDNVALAVEVAKRVPGVPVQLVWTREDDLAGGWYRPMAHHRITAHLDHTGKPTAWQHVAVAQPLGKGTAMESFLVDPKTGIESSIIEGVVNLPYAVGAFHLSAHQPDSKIPVLWWRSVGHTHTGYAVECFIDDCAKVAQRDPLAYRLELLKDNPRFTAVLKLVAEKSGWGKPLPKGMARGVAIVESFNSVVAEVAEVSLVDGQPKVHRVVVAVDCGTVVNPQLVEQQVQSGVAYGLSAALREAVTFEDDRNVQTNLHQYRALRFSEMPVVEAHFLPSEKPPTGIGEPAVPPIGPAVANALFALTGKRVRDLPISKTSFT